MVSKVVSDSSHPMEDGLQGCHSTNDALDKRDATVDWIASLLQQGAFDNVDPNLLTNNSYNRVRQSLPFIEILRDARVVGGCRPLRLLYHVLQLRTTLFIDVPDELQILTDSKGKVQMVRDATFECGSRELRHVYHVLQLRTTLYVDVTGMDQPPSQQPNQQMTSKAIDRVAGSVGNLEGSRRLLQPT
ncbi:hypothetical protein J6590_071422 [Homalodisca vitripennis]|nr:hypothetical protein J6590_071422 [Homalodisca vitripennis]